MRQTYKFENNVEFFWIISPISPIPVALKALDLWFYSEAVQK